MADRICAMIGCVETSHRSRGLLAVSIALLVGVSACSSGEEVVAGEVDAEWCRTARAGFRARADLKTVRYFESDDLPYVRQLDQPARERVEEWLASKVESIRELGNLEIPASIEEAWIEVVTRGSPVIAGGLQTGVGSGKGLDWDEAWGIEVNEFLWEECGEPIRLPSSFPPELLRF